MEKVINKLKPKSEFTKNVLTLMTGTTIAQAIPIAISPILTRLYTPEDFGVFALFTAITGILGTIANGRYELALMLPKKDEDAINLFAAGFLVNITFSFLIFIVISIFHENILNLTDIKAYAYVIYIIPLSVLLTGIYNLLIYFNNRLKQYKDIAKANVYKSLSISISQVLFGFLNFEAKGLIIGQIISQMTANLRLFFNIYRRGLLKKVKFYKIKKLAVSYKEFFLLNSPSAILDTLTLQLPYLILPKLYSVSIVGQFFLSNRVLFTPAYLISSSISQVYLQKISTYYKEKVIMPFFLKIFSKLLLISSGFSIFFFLFSPIIFKFIFGSDWIVAGEISRYLAIILFFRFVVSPLSSTFVLKDYVKLGSIWQVLYLFTTGGVFLTTFYLSMTFYQFLIMFTINEVFMYILYLLFIIYSIIHHDRSIKTCAA